VPLLLRIYSNNIYYFPKVVDNDSRPMTPWLAGTLITKIKEGYNLAERKE
jgi:hypothetical protein